MNKSGVARNKRVEQRGTCVDSDAKDRHILEDFVYPRRAERLREVLARRTDALTVVVEDLNHPHNISAVLRSAEAFGLLEVYTIGARLEVSRPISLGTERWMEIREFPTAEPCIAALREAGFSLVVMQPDEPGRPPSLPVTDLPFEKRLALVFGNERDGVSSELTQAADLHAHIPMYGFVESLNVSVAAAIALFCSSISGARCERRVPPLPQEKFSAVLDRWMREDVRAAPQILKRLGVDEGQTK